MTITVGPQTEQLIESAMKQQGFSSAQEVVHFAIQQMQDRQECDDEGLNEETRAAIEEGQCEIDAGLGRPWAEVDAELRARFVRSARRQPRRFR